MVTQLQPDVRAYLHGGEVIKRYIRVEEVAHEYGFSVEETEYIAKAASSLYKLTRIHLVKKERFDEFMKHIYKVPGTNKQIIKKPDSSEDVSSEMVVRLDKINEKYGTHFTEMDKVLVQMENDYANQEKWQSYAKNNDRATFMLLFEKDFPNMAADRYEQNDQFFRKLFDDPDMMKQVMETVGSVLYERLKKKYIFDPKSGVIEEATPETYVEDTYLTKK